MQSAEFQLLLKKYFLFKFDVITLNGLQTEFSLKSVSRSKFFALLKRNNSCFVTFSGEK